MIEAINGVQAYQQVAQTTGAAPAGPALIEAPPANAFADTLVEAIGDIETQHDFADTMLAKLASGENVDLHGTMIELEKADIALRTMVSVRDRFISAYEQVMNMTV